MAFPEVFVAAVEDAAAQGQAGVGAVDGSAPAEAFEAGGACVGAEQARGDLPEALFGGTRIDDLRSAGELFPGEVAEPSSAVAQECAAGAVAIGLAAAAVAAG